MNDLMQTPVRDGASLWTDFDNLFEGFFRPVRRGSEPARGLVPPMDIVERENEYVIRAEMPGVSKDHIDVTLTDGVLTVTGESRREDVHKDGDRVLRAEREYGKFTRSVRLATQINERGVKAS